MKKFLLLGLFSLITSNIYAQEDNNDYETKPGERYGYIIDKGGKKIEGVVHLNGGYSSPWQNQLKVKFIAVSDIDKSKKRMKFKTYDADEIKEYMLYDGDTERHFESVKYTNTRESLNSSESSTGLGAGFKALNNLTRTSQFAELVTDGKIKVFKIYGYPTAFSAGSTRAITQQETDRLMNNPYYIYSKRGAKAEDLTPAKVKMIVADCPYTKAKVTKGEYGSLKNEEKKRTGLGKFIKNEIDNATVDKLSIVNEVIYDYNENCK
ncbi:hypothetical protein M2347_003383 [Chryseobacterium sp. H1D6B]|uniref:hypothetical protein n=1 Tax=Chryseobacterium sp. H1D6B TaxID=2940588 RepID=UPI0015CD29F4|nr:hypothetical protein [Chryseobacterium sp. H1D6B]MDH6253656.1 hypothetical protein [Chryseobacterium sp. H1D6B]